MGFDYPRQSIAPDTVPAEVTTAQLRRQRMFQGAQISRLSADWVTGGTSQDAELRAGLYTLRNRARQLVRDNDFARQSLRAIVSNVVGTGVQYQSQVRMLRGGGRLDSTINDSIEKAWGDWCRKDSVDVAGLLCFSDLERLAMRSVIESGEVFVRLYRGKSVGRSKVPLALQVLEADMLDDNYNGVEDNGNEVRMGVEVDEFHRPVAYHFFQKHPGDYQYGQKGNPYKKRIRVPASDVLHLYLMERPGQTRGISWFHSALMSLHMLGGYQESELVAARAGASLMGFVTSPEGAFPEDDVMDNQRVLDWQPGQWKYLAPGESVEVPTLHRPDTFEPFMRQCLRSIAAGLGVSYETVSRDFSQTTYSSSRLSLLEDRDNYRQIQGWLIENLHQVVFDAWLDMAALSGALNLPGYDNDPGRYNAAKWMPRSWEWVDPLKEVQAYKEAVRCGFMTQGEVVAKSGGDLDELLTTRANELERAQELGLVFDTNAAQVAFTGVEQPQAPEPALDPVKPGDTQPADPAADPPADPAAAEAP